MGARAEIAECVLGSRLLKGLANWHDKIEIQGRLNYTQIEHERIWTTLGMELDSKGISEIQISDILCAEYNVASATRQIQEFNKLEMAGENNKQQMPTPKDLCSEEGKEKIVGWFKIRQEELLRRLPPNQFGSMQFPHITLKIQVCQAVIDKLSLPQNNP